MISTFAVQALDDIVERKVRNRENFIAIYDWPRRSSSVKWQNDSKRNGKSEPTLYEDLARVCAHPATISFQKLLHGSNDSERTFFIINFFFY
ncbi:unnamed protein product [Caenorhabditis brenneri]